MFAGLLLHTATVYRRSGDLDRFGQPVDQNPSILGDEIGSFRCRLTSGRGGRVNDERSRDVFEVTYDLFAEIGADVNEEDTVKVTDAGGTVLLPYSKVKLKETKYDRNGPHHLELQVVVQRGAV